MGNVGSCLRAPKPDGSVPEPANAGSPAPWQEGTCAGTSRSPPGPAPQPTAPAHTAATASKAVEVLVQDVGTQDGISPKACSQYVLEEDGDPTCAFRAAVPSGQPWDQARYNIPNPPNDEERRQLGIALQLYSAPKCPELDFLMSTLCRIFEAPYSSMALYYNRSCWLAHTWGGNPAGEMPWKISACPWNCLVKQPQTIVCGDLMEDARFHHMPYVEAGLRCYVSAPLLASNGHRLGTVCFMDTEARKVDAGMCRVLNNFGELAIRILERHLQLAERLAAAHMSVPTSLQNLVHAAYTAPAGARSAPDASRENALSMSSGQNARTWAHHSTDRHAVTHQDLVPTPPLPPPAAAAAATAHPHAAGLPSDTTSQAAAFVSTQELSMCEQGGEDGGIVSGGEEGLVGDATGMSPADVLLASVLARQLRSVSAVHDACCLVVDTGSPGWPIVYADDTWKLWAGFPRAKVLGYNLQDVLVQASQGVAPLNWDALQRQADVSERFVVPMVLAVQPGQSPAPTNPSTRSNAGKSTSSMLQYPRLSIDSRPGTISAVADQLASVSTIHEQRRGTTSSDAHRGSNSSGSRGVANSGSRDRAATVSDGPLVDAYASHARAASVATANRAAAADAAETTEALLDSLASIEVGHHSAQNAFLLPPVASPAQGASVGSDAWPVLAPAALRAPGLVPDGHSDGPARGIRAFDLSFRPLALDVLDADALPLGIPSWVPLEACPAMLRLYAVRLHATAPTAAPTEPLEPSVKVPRRANTTLGQLANHLFPGLSVGQVLGRGGYGTAYSGSWHDVCVVVKVQDHELDTDEALRTAQIEIAVGQVLRHPHLVRTLAHGAAEVTSAALSPAFLDPTTLPSVPQLGLASEDMSTPAVGVARPHESVGAARPPEPGPAQVAVPRAPEPIIPEVYSGYSPLSRWLIEAEKEWDDFGDSCWFSHCEKEALIHRNPLVHRTSTLHELLEHMPPANAFVNAVAAADDAPKASRATSPAASPAAAAADSPDAAAGAAAAGPASPTNVRLTRRGTSGGVSQGQGGNGVLEEISYQPVLGAPSDLPESPAKPGPALHPGAAAMPPTTTPMQPHAALTAEQPSHEQLGGVKQGVSVADMGLLGRLAAAGASIAPSEQSMAATIQQHVSQRPAGSVSVMQYPMHIRTFAILEYCDAGSLQDAIDRGWLRKGLCRLDSPPNLAKILTLARHIVSGVGYLHECGVVHADLSAANVLLCTDKSVPSLTAATQPVSLINADDESNDTLSDLSHSQTASQGSSNNVMAATGGGATPNSGSADSGLFGTPSEPSSPVEDKAVLDRLYTLPTKRYSLAPTKPRTADEMHFIAKVADFGKSCLLGPDGVSKAGGYATITHMAPEVLIDRVLSPAADVYALGILLWQMFTGSRPWASLSHKQIIATVVSGAVQLEWPDASIAQLPVNQQPTARRLAELGTHCCAYEASNRPTVAQVQATIDTLIRELPAA